MSILLHNSIALLLLAIMLQRQNKTFLKFQLTWIEIRLHWAGVCFCPAVRVGGCQECSPLAGPSLARVPGPVEVSPSAAAGSETNYRTVLIWILNSRPWYLQMWEDSMRVFAILVYFFSLLKLHFECIERHHFTIFLSNTSSNYT